MRVTVQQGKREGFTTDLFLVFENGLELKTAKNLVWAGKAGREETTKQFNEVVAKLKDAGFDVEGEAPT